MKKKNRLYAIPYNGTNVDWFIGETLRRAKHIHHVYCELPFPSVLSHMQFMFQGKGGENERSFFERRLAFLDSCSMFLMKSKGKFKRICPINAMYYKFDTDDEFYKFGFEVVNLVGKYSLDGLILTDFRLARFVRGQLPDLEIHTSCNAYQWNIRQMQLWKDIVGVEIFNPPREILRVPSKLKEMHEAGFKLKCLVNEACLVGCPNSFNHQMAISLGCLGTMNGCAMSGPGDILRGNFILPRWQKYYDEYVTVYKISGRNVPNAYPFRALDAYLSEENGFPLSELFMSGVIYTMDRFLPLEVKSKITLNIVPDKLLTCECKDCSRCRLCDDMMKKIVPQEYWDRFYCLELKPTVSAFGKA